MFNNKNKIIDVCANSPVPVCQWKAEPRVQMTSLESPGQRVQTSSSCSPAETAWWKVSGSEADGSVDSSEG